MKPPGASTVLLVLAGCLVAGCSGAGAAVYLNDGVRPGTPVFYGTIQVYAARDIGRPMEEMGSICVTISAEVPGGEFLKRMQKEAGRIGAHAVVAYEQWGNSAVGIAVRPSRRERPRTGRDVAPGAPRSLPIMPGTGEATPGP